MANESYDDDMFENAADLQEHAFVAVLNTGIAAQEALKKLQKPVVIHANLLINHECLMSGNSSRIEAIVSHLDMLIIVSNLSDPDEMELACKIVNISKANGASTLVYNLVPFNHAENYAVQSQRLETIAKLNTDMYLQLTEETEFESIEVKANRIKDAIDAMTTAYMVPSIIGLDFADVKLVIDTGRIAVLGIGTSSEAEKAPTATERALSNRDLTNIDNSKIDGIFVTFSAGMTATLDDFESALSVLNNIVPEHSTVVVGCQFTPKLNGLFKVSIILVGDELY
jgi:cell division GTPase FtsZ